VAFSQVTIPDPNFRQFLITNFPSSMNPDQTLKPSGAAAVTGPFKCYNKNITNLSGIEYFTGITTLEVKYNPGLKTIPNISGLTNITIIGLDSNGLTTLPSLSSLVNLKILSCHHNKLTSIPSLNGLTLLELLFVHYNNITTLPDLTGLVNLDWILCSNNPLTSLPDFSTLVKLRVLMCQNTLINSIPSLNNCPLMEYLICTDNKVTNLPAMNNCVNLIELDVFNCKLSSLPDLSIYPALTMVKAGNNYLSFEDLKILMPLPNFSSFVLSPQLIANASNIVGYDKSPINLDLGIDAALTDNVYTWYKNGIFFQTTIVNKLTFNSVTHNDAGIYTCRVTNTTAALTVDTLIATAITLTVAPCILSYDLRYEIITSDCSYPIKVMLDETSLSGGTKPYSYTVKFQNDSSQFSTSSFTLQNEGVYDLIVKDAGGCKVNFSKKLNIPRSEKCDPVFYPNGDGIADTYFINETGSAKIYNREGEIVKRLTIPAHWDGTNATGQDAPTGLYVIEINNSTSIRVTLLR
jgi:internalin A